MMTPERWKQLDEIFHAAHGRDGADRAAYLAEACHDDESLERSVVSPLSLSGPGLTQLSSAAGHVVRRAAKACAGIWSSQGSVETLSIG